MCSILTRLINFSRWYYFKVSDHRLSQETVLNTFSEVCKDFVKRHYIQYTRVCRRQNIIHCTSSSLTNVIISVQENTRDIFIYRKDEYTKIATSSPVVCGCKIHRLYLCKRVVRPPLSNKCLGYNIKPFDGKAPALEIWNVENPSLPVLPGPLKPGVVARIYGSNKTVQVNDRR